MDTLYINLKEFLIIIVNLLSHFDLLKLFFKRNKIFFCFKLSELYFTNKKKMVLPFSPGS